MELAADALDSAGIDRDTAIPYEVLLDTHLPQRRFRGRENRLTQSGAPR
jgi:hypothetical protein